jgi:hypothetical protein
MEEGTIKKVVEIVLERNVEARNDDRILIFEVLKEMYYVWEEKGNLLINKKNIKELPSFESIRRIRQFIQSPKGENRLNASEEIEKKRQRKEEQMHNQYSKKFNVNEMKNSNLIW